MKASIFGVLLLSSLLAMAAGQTPFGDFATFRTLTLGQGQGVATQSAIRPFDGSYYEWGQAGSSHPNMNNRMWLTVAAGIGYSCGIERGTFLVYCELQESSSSAVVTNLPSGLTAFRIAASRTHACALTFDASLVDSDTFCLGSTTEEEFRASVGVTCWGTTVGIGTTYKLEDTTNSSSSDPYVDVSVGDSFSCVLFMSGRAECTGTYVSPLSSALDKDAATQAGSGNYAILQSDSSITCGVTTAGGLDCWGICAANEFDINVCKPDLSGITLSTTAITSLVVNEFYVCALADDLTRVCSSESPDFQGSDPAANSTTFRELSGNDDVLCGMRIDDSIVECWGVCTGSGGMACSVPSELYEVPCSDDGFLACTTLVIVDRDTDPYECVPASCSNGKVWSIDGACTCTQTFHSSTSYLADSSTNSSRVECCETTKVGLRELSCS